MYGANYIFIFLYHPTVKTVEMIVQRVDLERNLKHICPGTVTKHSLKTIMPRNIQFCHLRMSIST